MVDGGQQRVQAADPGVAEPGALLGVAVDLDDRVVDIDERVPAGVAGPRQAWSQPASRPARVRNREATASSWRTCPKVNARRNDPSVDGAYARRRPGPSRRAAAAPCHRSVGAGDHPGDQRGHLQPGVRALVGRHTQMLIGQTAAARPRRPAPAPGPAPPTTPDSGHRTPPTSDRECERVASQRCPSGLSRFGTVASPNLPARQGISSLRHAHTTTLIGGSRLSDALLKPVSSTADSLSNGLVDDIRSRGIAP